MNEAEQQAGELNAILDKTQQKYKLLKAALAKS
jgi:hypothetical protein